MIEPLPRLKFNLLAEDMAITGTHRWRMAKKLGRAVRLREHGPRVQLKMVFEAHCASMLN